MSTIKVRFRRLNGTLIVERPKWLWGWYKYTDYQNIVHEVDYRLNDLAEELLQLIEMRKVREDRFKNDIKLTERDRDQDYGYSEPFLVEISQLGPISMNLEKPKQLWKELPSKLKKLLKQERITVGGKVIREDDHAPRSTKTTYVHEDFKEFSGAVGKAADDRGVDQSVVYRSNKDKKGKGGDSSFDPNNRKKQSGESTDGHKARNMAINNGADVSDWNPH